MTHSNYDFPPRLPTEAVGVWTCYLDMQASKQAHFEYLAELEAKVQGGTRRTLAENARLDWLLSQHNICVAAFTKARKQLAVKDAGAYQILVELLSEAHASIGAPTESH